ncbi:MAG: rhodanese-like domain-containing protein, partial [Pseudomonadota bacterium]
MSSPKRAMDLVKAAEAAIETLTVEAAEKLLADPAVVFVDVRDVRELQREGKIPGAYHAPRGMLEFWIDPTSPDHKSVFDPAKTF